jgi:hypothetical protein
VRLELKAAPLPANFQPYLCDSPEKLVWGSLGCRNMQLMVCVAVCGCVYLAESVCLFIARLFYYYCDSESIRFLFSLAVF